MAVQTEQQLAELAARLAYYARERIAHPDWWTTGTYAKTADGRSCTALDRAAKYSLNGALIVVFAEQGIGKGRRPLWEYLEKRARARGWKSMADLNDRGGHAVALAFLDALIAEVN